MNYTHGEWIIIDNRIISEGYVSKTPIATVHKRRDHEMEIANAHLISAAPLMYEALTRIKSLIDSGDWQLPKGFCETEINWINTALAKAEGTNDT
jgi:hypothetical protein